MDIRNKVAFITGGASGIGLAIAESLAARGARIAIADIENASLERARARLEAAGAEVIAIKVDVTDREAMEQAAQVVEQRFGGVDILCNNAGVIIRGSLEQATYEDWDWILGVNLQGVINGIVTFLPRLKARGRGHIVNTASTAGLVGLGQLGLYGATKFAVVGLSETLRQDMEPLGIGVSLLCPGAVDTSILTSHRNRLGGTGSGSGLGGAQSVRDFMPASVMGPGKVGEMVANAIEANEFYIVTHPTFRDTVIERHERLLQAFEK